VNLAALLKLGAGRAVGGFEMPFEKQIVNIG